MKEKERQPKILISPLSQRESQILWLVGCGLRNTQIASFFDISTVTIHTHLSNIKLKMADNGFIREELYYKGSKNLRGSGVFMAESAAEHGLIPPLPKGAGERISFLKEYHFNEGLGGWPETQVR